MQDENMELKKVFEGKKKKESAGVAQYAGTK